MRLLKYQALGNDYLLVEPPASLQGLLPLLPQICDRHRGLGADGLLAFDPGDLSLRVFNPDGSEAQKSGNGLRIAACHAVLEHGLGDEFELRAGGLPCPVRILSRDAAEVVSEVDMGPASFHPADLPALFDDGTVQVRLETPAGAVDAVLVSVGNPHCVVLGQPVTPERCLELGPHLERHPAFPERVNVQLAEALGRGRARTEIWERGAGRTLASGSSATAVAAALMRLGLVDETVEVVMPGGALQVRRDGRGSLLQAGPARRVYRAHLHLPDLA